MGKTSYKDEEEYRRRRERNNEAVKKSRVKSKMRSQATHERVTQLQNDNTKLEEKIKYLVSEVDFLKEMLCANQGEIRPEDSNRVQSLLNDHSTDSSSNNNSSVASGSRRIRKSTEGKY